MHIIPDNEILYRYAHPKAFIDGEENIPPSIFDDPELSCDWAKYQENPEKSYHIAEGKSRIIEILVCDDIRNPKNPKRTGQVVQEWQQDIIHKPVRAEDDPVHGENYSHSLIKGRKKQAVRDAIAKNSKFRF